MQFPFAYHNNERNNMNRALGSGNVQNCQVGCDCKNVCTVAYLIVKMFVLNSSFVTITWMYLPMSL